MREILFRGKWAGLWLEGDLRQYESGKTRIHDRHLKQTLPIDRETLGQFTGLLDRNGKRIFEGDIVDHYYQANFSNRGVIIWDQKEACFAHKLNTIEPRLTFYNPEAHVVVGNIFDNPELLGSPGDK